MQGRQDSLAQSEPGWLFNTQNDLMNLKSQLKGWTDLMLENVEITNDMDVHIYIMYYVW